MRRQEPDRVPLFYRDVPDVGRRLQRDLGTGIPSENVVAMYDAAREHRP